MTEERGYHELYRILLTVHDTRSDHGKLHKLPEVLFLAVVALIAGAQNAEDIVYFCQAHLEWLRGMLVLEHGVPSHGQVRRARRLAAMQCRTRQ